MARKNRSSRYRLMSTSEVVDEETGEAYPDVLTAEYQDFRFTRPPTRYRLRPQDVDKFFNLHKRVYGTYAGDDILLDLNLIPHRSYLEAGTLIFLPGERDKERFMATKTPQARRRL